MASATRDAEEECLVSYHTANDVGGEGLVVQEGHETQEELRQQAMAIYVQDLVKIKGLFRFHPLDGDQEEELKHQEKKWKSLLGNLFEVPFDGRCLLGFQKRALLTFVVRNGDYNGEFEDRKLFQFQDDVLLYIYAHLSNELHNITTQWKELAEYFDQIFTEKDAIFDQVFHDSLLTDDESFSRSKNYFWAITTLQRLIDSIALSMKQLSSLVDMQAPDVFEQQHKEMFGIKRSELQAHYRWEKIEAIFKDKHKEIMDLREGLFNAGGVMESRASRQLGENIQLLTFVSIMFLPLSFCMSVWSVNNNLFSLESLWITAAAIAISTYVLAFNINIITKRSKTLCRRASRRIINSMKSDPDETWNKRANIFEKFTKPQETEIKPSNWRLVHYICKRHLSLSVLVKRVRDFDWSIVTAKLRRGQAEELPIVEPPFPTLVPDPQTQTPSVHSLEAGPQSTVVNTSPPTLPNTVRFEQLPPNPRLGRVVTEPLVPILQILTPSEGSIPRRRSFSDQAQVRGADQGSILHTQTRKSGVDSAGRRWAEV
ncbi:hypothetical protein EG329_002333 [Mollisiaceae sp. DMI_Dod_QoI]|nr:hypothetical protein EG329_002333 [Helotiales sp. DMI_Dod_QoI]